jgi:hypothetical protein
MKLTDADIDAFIDMYEEEYGERLSKAEASDMAHRFMALYELLARPLPDEERSE